MDARAIDDLRRVPLFAGLKRRQLKKLSRRVRRRILPAGGTPVREGTMSGIGFFVVVDGEADVSLDGAVVATLRPGDHFGERALVSGEARTATVTATTELRLLELASYDLRELALANPELSWRLAQHVVEAAASSSASSRRPGQSMASRNPASNARAGSSVAGVRQFGRASALRRPSLVEGGPVAEGHEVPVDMVFDACERAPCLAAVEFASPDESRWSAIGGGETLEEAVDFAFRSAPEGQDWRVVRVVDLYGD
jgi:hypothetical protein